MATAIELIRTNYDKALYITRLAKTFGIGPSNFHHHLKSETTMSPLQFQKQLRLQEARRLLVATTTMRRPPYLSEVFFNEEFPNMAGGYGVSWIGVLDAVKALDADIFIPGHGPIPDDPKQTRAALDRMQRILVEARDGLQTEIAKGASEDQAVAAVKLDQYAKLYAFAAQREVVLRRMYKELKGTLP